MPQPHQIQVTSATYNTTHCNTGSLTPRLRPEIKPASLDASQIHFSLSHNGNLLFIYSFIYFLFWLLRGIWSSQTRDQIQAAGISYTTAASILDPLTHHARDGTCVLVLQRCRQSHCTTVATPISIIFDVEISLCWILLFMVFLNTINWSLIPLKRAS